MRILDVTVPTKPDVPVYPGDPEVRLTRALAIADGDTANASRLDFGVHPGTHADAPLHFVEGGRGVDALRLGDLVGPAVVVETPELPDDVALPAGAERVLFRTRNSELWAQAMCAEDFVTIGLPLARRPAENGVRLVGIDYLSVGDPEVHRLGLGLGVVAILIQR